MMSAQVCLLVRYFALLFCICTCASLSERESERVREREGGGGESGERGEDVPA